MTDAPQIFLCYANEDKEEVEQIYSELRRSGLNPWMDKPPQPFQSEGIGLGEDWDLRLRKEISKSAYFFAFLSNRSVSKRGYVQREYRIALNAMAEMPAGQVFLVPVLLEQCPLPEIDVDGIRFSKLQWLDLSADGLHTLVNFVKNDQNRVENFVRDGGILHMNASNSEQFFDSIGNNRSIELTSVDYNISASYRFYCKHIQPKRVHDGESLVFDHLSNMTVSSSLEKKAELYVTPRYAQVLHFKGCRNLSLRGLSLGHRPEKGGCQGGVVLLENCSDIDIEGCQLFGCGVTGISMSECSRVRVRNSQIYECTEGIVVISKSQNVEFDTCEMFDNEFWRPGGVAIEKSKTVLFRDCVFRNNKASLGGKNLVKSDLDSTASFLDCVFDSNVCEGISDPSERVVLL